MIVKSYRQPESSFLSMEKDLGIISDLMLKNERLKKLLYYTTPECLNKPKLTQDQTYELFGKNIKIVPRLHIDKTILNYVIVSFEDFAPSENPEFRTNLIAFDIVCHYDQWQLKDFQLRPYRIAAEIDTMLKNQRLTGIGELEFWGAAPQAWGDDFGGLTIFYNAVHGGEDKKKMTNPADEEKFVEDFSELFNNG